MVNFKRIKNQTGFTLIELLASIFIISLISTIFIVNYHNTNNRSLLNVTKQKLVSDIRLAQNYSLGSKKYNTTNTPSGGWGAHFSLTSPSNYLIFADLDSSRSYDNGEAIETKNLPVGVTIDSIKVNGTDSGSVDIIFFPPDPVTYINGLSDANTKVILKENINNSTGAVMVNFFGLIDAVTPPPPPPPPPPPF
jgi:prepilin-type N-terminal cleavage/methylation domain-containing protein